MKIGLVTITSGANFGNRLQNYAVQKIVEKEGIQAETIKNNSISKSKMFVKNMIKRILYGKNYRTREKLFANFNKSFINYSSFEIVNHVVNKNINNYYDYFMCGSDQVWNPSYEENKLAHFLSFSDYEKNIAYAPSFGVSEIPSHRVEEYAGYLKNIKHLSVRENAGAKIIKTLIDREAVVLLDPTMMLDKTEWDVIAKKPKGFPEQKYIFKYFLGKPSLEQQNEIKRVAEENNCIIIDALDKNAPFYTMGPSEFVYLIANAFLVCTDSFHSCIFPIIYDVPFINFKREGNEGNMNSRLETLLTKFNLKNRSFTGEITEELLRCDYSEAKEILAKEQEKSKLYLKTALGI